MSGHQCRSRGGQKPLEPEVQEVASCLVCAELNAGPLEECVWCS